MTKCLLYYLLPWLYNMELVDPNVNSEGAAAAAAAAGGEANAGSAGEADGSKAQQQQQPQQHHSAGLATGHHREGWGTSEATEMITNNLFYITVKVRLCHVTAECRNVYFAELSPSHIVVIVESL